MRYLILVGILITAAILMLILVNTVSGHFNWLLNSNRVIGAAFFTVVICLCLTYACALFFQKCKIIEPVGSVDAWIGFAGAGMGGIITMLALYFTLKNGEEKSYQTQIISLKPYVVCSITNLDKEENKIMIEDCINSYGFIKCRMKNISNNIANRIKIVDEYSIVKGKKMQDLSEEYGIGIFTVIVNDGTFLAPQEEYNWKTNFYVETGEDGKYKWQDSAFDFTHTIIFQFTDVADMQTYEHKFEFEVNINVDIENKLHFFLWNIGNSMNAV